MVIGIPVKIRKGVATYAIVDQRDAHLAAHSWWATAEGYAARQEGRSSVRMHREIMDPPSGMEVDHIDGNPLNNRRSNLRLVTRKQQAQNVAPHRDGSSRYRGVSWDTGKRRWRAEARLNGERHHIGWFIDEDTAAQAASVFRREHMTHTNEARLPQAPPPSVATAPRLF